MAKTDKPADNPSDKIVVPAGQEAPRAQPQESPFAAAYRAYNARLQEIANGLQTSLAKSQKLLRDGQAGSTQFPDPNARFLEVGQEHARELNAVRGGAAAQSEKAFHDFARALQNAWSTLDVSTLDPHKLQEINIYQGAAVYNAGQMACLIPPPPRE